MLRWFGKDIKQAMDFGSKEGINATMQRAVQSAKNNHPGWENETGRAEDSIKIQTTAEEARDGVLGEWGSIGIPYMLRLEFQHGRALQRAADNTYGKLAKEIRKRWRFSPSLRRTR